MTLDEIFAAMPEATTEEAHALLYIDPNTRQITVPESESIFGVVADGRGWGFNTFYLDEKADGAVVLDYPENLADMQEILAADPCAIIVNGYAHNLGVCEGYVTRDNLARFLRWQYDLQNALLSDFMECIVQPA